MSFIWWRVFEVGLWIEAYLPSAVELTLNGTSFVRQPALYGMNLQIIVVFMFILQQYPQTRYTAVSLTILRHVFYTIRQ